MSGVEYSAPAGLKFALQAMSNTSTDSIDLHMLLQFPTKYGWGATALGAEMAGSTMFVLYPSSNGKTATLSTRLGKGNFEPNYDPSPACYLGPSEVNEEIIKAGFVCYGMGENHLVTRDPSRTAWMWALGPDQSIKSNSPAFHIEEHKSNGGFSLNMVDARVAAPPPSPTKTSTPSSSSQSHGKHHRKHSGHRKHHKTATHKSHTTKTHSANGAITSGFSGSNKFGSTFPTFSPGGSAASRGSITTSASYSPNQPMVMAHAALLASAFLGIFPLGILCLRYFRNVRVHWMVQILGFIAAFIGWVIALAMCASLDSQSEYGSFHTTHQIFGILVGIMLLPQLFGGFLNHWKYRQRGYGVQWVRRIHLWFGRLLIPFGMLTAVLGFQLNSNTTGAVVYGVFSLVVIMSVVAINVWDRRRESASPEDNHQPKNTQKRAHINYSLSSPTPNRPQAPTPNVSKRWYGAAPGDQTTNSPRTPLSQRFPNWRNTSSWRWGESPRPAPRPPIVRVGEGMPPGTQPVYALNLPSGS